MQMTVSGKSRDPAQTAGSLLSFEHLKSHLTKFGLPILRTHHGADVRDR
jgi:hypothetical protein